LYRELEILFVVSVEDGSGCVALTTTQYLPLSTRVDSRRCEVEVEVWNWGKRICLTAAMMILGENGTVRKEGRKEGRKERWWAV
jgi:hypothetical protein